MSAIHLQKQETWSSYLSLTEISFSNICRKVCKIGVGVLAVVASLNLPTAANAQEIVNSTEFRMNNYTADDQRSPQVTALENRTFVGLWTSEYQTGGFNRNIFAQVFNGEVKVGVEFQVDEGETQSQYGPCVADLGNGTFAAAWYGPEIHTRIFDVEGTPLTPAIQANTHTGASQTNPAIAAIRNGTYTIAWESWGVPGGDDEDLAVQFFCPNGTRLGEETTAYDVTGGQDNAKIIAFQDQSFLITLRSRITNNGGLSVPDHIGIIGQKFDANGTKIGPVVSLSNTTLYSYNLCVLDNDDFVTVWNSQEPDINDGDGYGVFAQIYTNNGSILVPTFLVNDFSSDDQLNPDCTGLPGRGFSVVWESGWNRPQRDIGSYGIRIKSFDYTGTAYGPEVRVDQNTTEDQSTPTIDAFENGEVITAWQGLSWNGTYWDVFGRIFDPILSITPAPTPTDFSSQQTTNETVFYNSTRTESAISATSSMQTFGNSNTPSPPSSQARTSSTIFSQSTQSNEETTSTLASTTIPSITILVYGESYPIRVDGEIVGYFYFTGGEGALDYSNTNTLHIQLDQDIAFEDGLTTVIFTIPDGEEDLWQDLFLMNSDSECFNAEGEPVFDEENAINDYQLIFELDESGCIYSDASRLSAILMLTVDIGR